MTLECKQPDGVLTGQFCDVSVQDVISMELKDSRDHCQQLMFTIDVQKQRLHNLQNEVEEREQQITGYYSMLEVCHFQFHYKLDVEDLRYDL